MNKLVILATALVALLSATPALAIPLTFDFSFTSNSPDANIAGTVTGEIIVTGDNSSGPATVFLTSYPAGLSTFCTVPCLVTSSPWTTFANEFDVVGGSITQYVLNTQIGDLNPVQLILADTLGGQGLLRWYSPDGIYQVYSTSVNFSLVTTPLPAALPLFATGLGVLAFLARRRKHKNVAALAAA